MTKTISMKKMYQWASEYSDWRISKGYKFDVKDMEKRVSIIVDYLRMIWEKRNK